MLFPALVLFFFFLLLSAFFSSSETAFVATSPLKLSLLFSRPTRFFIVFFYPLVKTFTYVTRLIFPSQKRKEGIPQLNDSLEFNGHRFIIKEMGKRRINTVYAILKPGRDE